MIAVPAAAPPPNPLLVFAIVATGLLLSHRLTDRK